MKTFQPTQKEVKREIHEIDADNLVLGRLATRIATLLMGKHKPTYSAHMDSGDYVHVKNIAKIAVTGGKEDKKVYYKHSGFPNGFREVKFRKLLTERPERILEMAVFNMLPVNRLRDRRMRRMKFV